LAIDNSGTIKYANNTFTTLLGLQPSEVIGKNIWKLQPHLVDTVVYTNVLRCIEKKEVITFEWFGKKTGRYLETSLFPSEQGVTAIGRDVTERKKSENAILESEQLYRTLFDNSEYGFILFRPVYDNTKINDLIFLKLNSTYETQTGRRIDFVLGKKVSEIEPNLERYWISACNIVLKKRKILLIENFNQRTARWYDAQFFPYGEGLVGVLFKDVTERKQAEKTLREKKEELNRILDCSPIIVFYKDKTGKFIQANRAFAEALMVSKESLVGKTVFDIYSSEIAQQMRNDDLIVMGSKKPKLGIVEPYESPTGLRWIRTDKIPIFDENGDVNGLIGFSLDITGYKKAEDALRESEKKYEQLVNKLPEMVFEIDNRGRVFFANARALETLGYTLEELTNNFDANRFVAPEDVERSRENMKKMFFGHMRQSNEYTFMRKDGTKLSVLLTSSPIVNNGTIIGARGVAVDLTVQKEMERRLKENERLAVIGATAGMVGHDIRNPLQSIAGDLYLIDSDVASLPPGDTKNSLQESVASIQANLLYVDKIVTDLQDYAKNPKPILEKVNIEKIIEEIMVLISIPNNLKVVIEVEKTFPGLITDSSMVKRALFNLVNNAVQAMPDGGTLTIGAYDSSDKVFLCVEDTGVGIPEDIKPKLFLPMVTTKAQGQGFGLAVVKRLVEALNGTVSFESENGKGTKFTICLPKNKTS
jgi:PAS domain S-box-containing protein